jgi:hypothetical protein
MYPLVRELADDGITACPKSVPARPSPTAAGAYWRAERAGRKVMQDAPLESTSLRAADASATSNTRPLQRTVCGRRRAHPVSVGVRTVTRN